MITNNLNAPSAPLAMPAEFLELHQLLHDVALFSKKKDFFWNKEALNVKENLNAENLLLLKNFVQNMHELTPLGIRVLNFLTKLAPSDPELWLMLAELSNEFNVDEFFDKMNANVAFNSTLKFKVKYQKTEFVEGSSHWAAEGEDRESGFVTYDATKIEQISFKLTPLLATMFFFRWNKNKREGQWTN